MAGALDPLRRSRMQMTLPCHRLSCSEGCSAPFDPGPVEAEAGQVLAQAVGVVAALLPCARVGEECAARLGEGANDVTLTADPYVNEAGDDYRANDVPGGGLALQNAGYGYDGP